jgi:parallel beta-helix repeat protein
MTLPVRAFRVFASTQNSKPSQPTARLFALAVVCAAIVFSAASPAMAKVTTLAVGTCEPNYTSFSTISQAVNSAPSVGTTTIYVCPGIYQEQVQIIGKAITLKGVASGSSPNISNAAIIEPPAPGGLVTNATSALSNPPNQPIQAMVLVQNTTATIEDLTIDGTNNMTVGGQDPIGIFYQNASGTVTRNNVIHVQVVGAFGDQGGLGVYVESGTSSGGPNPSQEGPSTVTLSYNNVQDYDKNGITANGTPTGTGSNVNVTVEHNTVMGAGAVDDNAQNGIQLWGANGSVTYNIVDGDWYTVGTYAAAGVLIIQSYAPTVSNNTISNTNVGIYLESVNPGDTNNATVNANSITATHIYDAIVACANASMITNNTVNFADESGVNVAACGDATPTDTVTTNTMNGACAGILYDPPATATTTPGGDTYYNVSTQVLSSATDSCSTPLIKKQGGGHKVPAARPAGGLGKP